MKKLLSIAAASALALTLAGCGNDDTGDGGTDGSDSYRVGVTFSDLGNPVWAELVQEATAYGAERGISITSVDAQSNSATQVTQIENFIQNDVDAIIICAVESNAVADVTKRAQDAGIKVIGYTQTLTNYDAQYLVDAYSTGYANGEAAAAWITENYGDSEVEWGLMDLPTFPEIIDRANGIKEAIAEHAPNAKLVATAPALTAEDGVSNAEGFLQANPNLKVIATIGGGGAVGANTALRGAVPSDQYPEVGVFGIDATEQEIRAIIAGDPQKTSVSLGGGKAHGRTLVDITYELLTGEDVEPDQYMPITVIDSSNAEEYLAEVFGEN